MLKQLTKTIRIKTAPFNWIVQKRKGRKWSNIAYYDRLEQVRYAIPKRIKIPEEEIKKELKLKTEEESSAWYLTRIKKHKEFSCNISPNSLKNLNSQANLSGKFQRKG
jgi:hypothetical protein